MISRGQMPFQISKPPEEMTNGKKGKNKKGSRAGSHPSGDDSFVVRVRAKALRRPGGGLGFLKLG